MTSYVGNWRESSFEADQFTRAGARADVSGGGLKVPAAPTSVTGGIVDEAVSVAVKEQDLADEVAHTFKALLTRDVGSGPAHAYFNDQAVERRSRLVGVGKPEIVVHHALSDLEMQYLTEYAPEYRFVFKSDLEHDHAMSAQCRIVDTRLVRARLPASAVVSDVGGNPLVHIAAGDRKVHTCGPVVDRKDAKRHVTRRMRAAVLRDSDKPEVARLASAYLLADRRVVCDSLAQDCTFQSKVIMSVHVYDIPISDWPAIMERKGAVVVEGCLLFSSRFFEHKAGDLSVVGGRYEIDMDEDTIKMGFKGSPSWWYQHKWSSFMAYGVDQVIHGVDHTYSYRVVERRGDTLFFRILRMPAVHNVPAVQHYKLPDAQLVQVDSFDLRAGELVRQTSHLPRRRSFYPYSLWRDMVSGAAEDFERGVMDFRTLENRYRTVSARQSINSVCIMGGQKVPVTENAFFIVDVGLAAAAEVHLGRRTTRGITDNIMAKRSLEQEYTMTKMLRAFWASVCAVASLPLFPLKWLGELLDRAHGSLAEQAVLTWAPEVEVKSVNAVTLLTTAFSSKLPVFSASALLRVEAADNAMFDHYQAMVRNPELARLVCGLDNENSDARGASEQALFEEESVVQSPTAVESASATVVEPPVDIRRDDLHAQRVAAIKEYIRESEMEVVAVTDASARAFRDVTSNGNPNKSALVKYAELHGNPDLWFVSNGVLQDSVLGISTDNFKYSAVYTPVPTEDGSCIRDVFKRKWEGLVAGTLERRKHRVISDTSYNGYVLTMDRLVVHNGPDMMVALRAALDIRHDYVVKLECGPPGCGKTYSIIQNARCDGSDVVMCPVRESIKSTKWELHEVKPNFPDLKLRVRTVDSYLVNRSTQRRTRELTASRLLADECFMAHSAKWYAAAAMLGVNEVLAYGDPKQIPHVPRVQASKMFVRIVGQHERWSWLIFRFGPRMVAAISDIYGHKIRSAVPDRDTTITHLRTHRGFDIPPGAILMVGYQAWKKDLYSMFSQEIRSKKLVVMSIHESEGKTFDHVVIFNFDLRQRSDKFSLYDREEYVNVAISRARFTTTFIWNARYDCEMMRRITRSEDVRRVAAAADVESAGQSLEFL